MSETSPVYFAAPPALLTSDQLAAITDALAGERQSCADEPAHPLGYWPTAVAALLAHAEALSAEAAHSNDCAQRAYAREIDAITARSKAEARVKEQQSELADQEVEKWQLIRELSLAVGSAPISAR